MKYTKEERLEIGRRIYDGEINRYDAAFIYDISEDTARQYMRLYRASKQLPAKSASQHGVDAKLEELRESKAFREDIKAYDNMTRAELILELLKYK